MKKEMLKVKIESVDPPTPYNVVVYEEKGSQYVSFYDARYDFTEHGQFVSGYYLDTLIEDRAEIEVRGLDLMGYEPSWKVDIAAMKELFSKITEWKVEEKVRKTPLGAKVLAIMKAMDEGLALYLETYAGTLRVTGMSYGGTWAITGKDLAQRTWALCSTVIDSWYVRTLGRII